jgi:hypothetical protein
MRFRLPAGVRVDGKGWGGRFMRLEDVPLLAPALDPRSLALLEKRIARDYRRAGRQLDRAMEKVRAADKKPPRAAERARGALGAVTEQARALRATRDAVRDVVAPKPKRKTPVAPAVADLDPDELQDGEDGDEAVEWAVGVSYNAETAHRPTSAVDVSILVRRIDEQPMPFREAKAVMTYVRQWRFVPVEYYLAAMDWRSPQSPHAAAQTWKGWQANQPETDLENFYNVLTALSDKPGFWTVKMGGLK